MEDSQAYSVGYLGPAGTFSEQAAREFIASAASRRASEGLVGAGLSGGKAAGRTVPGHRKRRPVLVPFRDIPELLTAVDRGEADVGVVPAENSIEGTVVVTLDMLVHEVDLTIVDEIVIPVRHHLLVRSVRGGGTSVPLADPAAEEGAAARAAYPAAHTAGDIAPDVAGDIAPDAAGDIAPDAAGDIAPDSAEDTAPDAAEDTAPDSTEDAAGDTSVHTSAHVATAGFEKLSSGAAAESLGRERAFLNELRASVTIVVSHPQALAQCRRFLQRHFPDAELRPALSTGAAAREVARAEPGTMAAIATELSAGLYGLSVAARDVQDVSDNATRFFVVARREAFARPEKALTGNEDVAEARHGIGIGERAEMVATRPCGRDKTTIVFGFAVDAPGNLYGALGEFANRGVNLSKLESRPTKHALGHYLFFADLDGHAHDPPVAEALDALAGRCAYMRVLGSYPKAEYAAVTRPRAFPPNGPRDSRRF